MKKIFLITLMLTTLLNAQNWNSTWEWENGNQTFRLFTISEEDSLGDLFISIKFRMINNLDESIIYASNVQNEPFEWYWPMSLYDNDELAIATLFMDFTHDDNRRTFKNGVLSLRYLNCNTTGCQPNLVWRLRPPADDMNDPSAPNEFNLPTDMVLTKVE